MNKKSVFIVIPTIRDLKFLTEWGDEFQDCSAIIIEDHPSREVNTPNRFFKRVYHYTWKDIQNDFSANEWIFSRRNAGIRCYGFYKAYTLGAEAIITLDDDCYPVSSVIPGSTRNLSYVKAHLDNLSFKAATDWIPTYPDPNFMYTRGFPYKIRHQLPVVVSHGLWSGALDLDAKTEVKLPQILTEKPYPVIRQIIPKNYFFPMCSMNLAFTRKVIPLMYFPLMGYDPQGNKWGFDRYDDIWAGLFVKKVSDHLGWGIVSGSPFVEHRKASLPKSNLAKEKAGLKINETLWREVKKVNLTESSATACYRELADKIVFPKTPYFTALRKAMHIWIDLFRV